MKTLYTNKGLAFTISDVDFEKFKYYTFYSHKNKNSGHIYIFRIVKIGTKYIRKSLARELVNAPIGSIVDHKDRNTLNNEQSNLRICNKRQNNSNSKFRRHSTPYRGVTFLKGRKRKIYKAVIEINGCTIYLGNFGSAVCVALVYDKKAHETAKDFATLNFPELLK